MKRLWQNGLILFFCFLASLIFAASNHTIAIDGTNDFASDEDVAGNDGSTWYFTWDSSNFYFGVVQGDIGGSPSSTKWVQLYIDTDPQQSNPLSGNGTSTGVQYNTQTPTLAFNGDYHFRWKLDDSWWGLMRYSGSWSGVTFNGARARNTGNNYVEFRIPWSDLGNPNLIRVCGLMMNETGGYEWTWAAFPSGSFTAGYGNKVFTHFQSYVIISGVAPDYAGHLDTYPTASNAASGNWIAAGSWIGSVVPNSNTVAYIQNGHTITLDGAGNVKYLRILSGGTYSGGSSILSIASNGRLDNSGTFNGSTGTVAFAGGNTVTGTVAFNNVDLAGGATDFGANATVNGTLLINTGGGVVTNGVTFGPASLLRYNTGGTFTAGAEWYENVPAGKGVPQNVQVSNNTSFRFGTAAFSRQASGNITIDAGSELRLSGTIGGDLRLMGNLFNNGTFTPNGRAVTFNGSVAQQFSNANFSLLYIDNPAGVSSLNDFGVNDHLSIQNNGVFHAGSNNINFGSSGNDGADLTVVSGMFDAGSSTCIFSGDTSTNPHTITGAISFYKARLGGGMAQFISGVPVIVNELEIVALGSIDLNNAPTFGVNSTLKYNTGGSYSAGNTWVKNATSGAGVPYHVQISAGTQLDFGADTEPRTLLGDLNINTGAQFTLSSAAGGGIYIKGDWSNAGTFQCNGKAVHFNGSVLQNVGGGNIFNYMVIDNPASVRLTIPQTIVNQLRIKQGGLYATSQSPNYQSGSALIFEVPTYTVGKEWADGTITQPGTPYQVLVPSGVSVSFPAGGAYTALDKITIEGSFTAPNVALKPRGDFEIAASASWNANGGTVMFEGGTTQNFIANKPIVMNNLYVNMYSTLVEAVPADNISVSGTLTNNNIIRKSQTISGAGAKTFGLTQAAINVTAQGGLTSVQVDRLDSTAPNATAATYPGKHWVVTPAGGGYALNLTLPHNVADHTKAYLGRWNGSAWEYGRTSSTTNTVTLNGVTQLSTWAIATPEPALDINGAASGVNYSTTFTEDGGAISVSAVDAFITDPDSATMSGATVTIDATPNGADESLDANVSGTSIIKSYSSATRILTLSGADTKANYEQVLRSVAYNNLSQNPDTTNRTLAFIVTDDTSIQSAPVYTVVTVVAQNDAPVISVNTGMSVSRGEVETITSAILSATDVDNTAAQITFNVTVGPNHGALRLLGSPTATFTQDDINNNRVTYAHGGGYDPTDAFTFNVSDGAGGVINGQTFNITLTPGTEVPDWKKIF